MFSSNRFQRRLATLDDNDFFIKKSPEGVVLSFLNHHQDFDSESVGNPESNLIIPTMVVFSQYPHLDNILTAILVTYGKRRKYHKKN